MAGDETTVTIERLGADGDGIATSDGARLFVPFTVPGDRVRVALGPARGGGRAARVVERLADGPGRAQPVCPHFGVCGGCAAQHLDDATYLAWKHDIVAAALARRGLDVALAPVVVAHGPRRRAEFALGHVRDRVLAGFRQRFDSAIVDVTACPVIDERLLALLGPLRALGADMPALGTRVSATVTDTGIDLVLEAPANPDAATLAGLAGFAKTQSLARLSLREPGAAAATVVERTAPTLAIAGVAVVPPPGGFIQATAAGEAAIGERVVAAASGARRVADLYAGLGTWTFRLASARVHAVEGDGALTAALQRAAARAGLAGRVTGETRDLARRPLGAEELAPFDAVVFDPPRAGAAPQAQELARSSVPLVIAVSCNPATFGRDARTLVDGGYRLEAVTPIDQFRYAAHVEVVGVFRR